MAKAAGILPAGRNPSAPEGGVKPAPPPNPPKAQEIEALRAEVERWRGECMKVLGLSMQAQAEAKDLRGACDVYQARAERLAEALKEIRSRSAMDWAMHPDPFELTALLGDIHKIADAALSKEEGK